MKRFRGGLVLKAHRLWHHSTLGSRVIKDEKGVFQGSGMHLLGSATLGRLFWRLEVGEELVILLVLVELVHALCTKPGVNKEQITLSANNNLSRKTRTRRSIFSSWWNSSTCCSQTGVSFCTTCRV